MEITHPMFTAVLDTLTETTAILVVAVDPKVVPAAIHLNINLSRPSFAKLPGLSPKAAPTRWAGCLSLSMFTLDIVNISHFNSMEHFITSFITICLHLKPRITLPSSFFFFWHLFSHNNTWPPGEDSVTFTLTTWPHPSRAFPTESIGAIHNTHLRRYLINTASL